MVFYITYKISGITTPHKLISVVPLPFHPYSDEYGWGGIGKEAKPVEIFMVSVAPYLRDGSISVFRYLKVTDDTIIFIKGAEINTGRGT